MSSRFRSETGLSAWVAALAAAAVDGGHIRADVPLHPLVALVGSIPDAACTVSLALLPGAADVAAALVDVAVKPATAAVADGAESEELDLEAQAVDVLLVADSVVGTVSAAAVGAPACIRSLRARAASAGVAAGESGASSRMVPCPFL